MRFATAFQIAFRALGRNKLRSALTILGITIGIGAVICTVAIGEGGSNMIREQLAGLGENMIWVEAGGRNLGGVRTGNGATKTLTADDSRAIRDLIPHVVAASPNVDGSVQVVYENQNWATRFRGVSEDYLEIRKWDVAFGSYFTEKDVNSMSNVCVVGHTVQEQLFGGSDPLGETIRMGTIPCLVIGVLQTKGQSSTGQDQDDLIAIPYTVAMHKLRGVSWLDDAYFSVDAPENISSAEDAISRLLRQRHHLRTDEPDDFNIRHPEDILQAQEQTSETFTLMLGSIASVSLLVGGIGIMNIMLVSVTERTREIGVRMAIGATEHDVQTQFLIEALALSLIGGAVGIAFGIGASFGISRALEWPTAISFLAIFVAAAFSAGIGIVFGYYPARKASALDPIEALRYE
ncbi:MAG TPA: ABC transporter permease [Candidatus Acidoferrum sp.]|jgi:putative ABC transport system permease protein|nr:ABC transporter permease [Candidatus Acidoferrum sp.]